MHEESLWKVGTEFCELKCQKIYEKLKSLRKAQAQKIRNGVKKSFKIRSEALSVIKQLLEECFLMEFKEQEKTFYRISRRNPCENSFLVP